MCVSLGALQVRHLLLKLPHLCCKRALVIHSVSKCAQETLLYRLVSLCKENKISGNQDNCWSHQSDLSLLRRGAIARKLKGR
jgi:hypothetical protein